MAKSWNPLAFTPWPVSFFLIAIYIAVFGTLLVIHHDVPPAPKQEIPRAWPGVNLTTAWHDLQTLSATHHPYNSRASLEVRSWLQGRIEDILGGHNASWTSDSRLGLAKADKEHGVVVFDDRSSNKTFPGSRTYLNYFEGDNLMVYIRGSDDPKGAFWQDSKAPKAGLILVNAHFDSVSTGYGTTDDGVGVISVLQLLSHFTSPQVGKVQHGLLLLLNNGEEDGLFGAEAFAQHPIAKHATAFLNLEGAGAGGRATLFRATDRDVVVPYGKSEHPFGTVLSADGFKRGLVRSGTDYSVFHDALGMRGLDVAFMGPRSAYHTDRDDVRDSSKDSLWHMLGAALTTTRELTETTWETGKDHEQYGVWLDVLGLAFATINLHTLFALSVTLLAVGPVVLILLEVLLKKSGKWYPFSLKTYLHGADDDEPIQLGGLKGFFRFPLAFVVSSAAPVVLAYLLTKINPYIVYSSPYSVWSMMMSAFIFVSWFLLRLGDSLRPSALSRLYILLWLYAVSWILVVGFAVGADRFQLGGDYFLVTFNAAIFVALLISYLELFALPSKGKFADRVTLGALESSARRYNANRPSSSRTNDDDEEEATERTALISPSDRQSFKRHGRGNEEEANDNESTHLLMSEPYEHEQEWSSALPRWTWLLQALVLLPLNLILVGQVALFLTTALTQTPADGNPVFTIYLAMAVLTIVLLVPSTPFIHRIIWQIPTFLFLVCVGTVVYNLIAEPFSREARLKIFFVQRLNATSGQNQVALIGLPGWVERVASEIPSTNGQEVSCHDGQNVPTWARRNELRTCLWTGPAPNVMQGYSNSSTTKALSSAPYAIQPLMGDYVSTKTHTIVSDAEAGTRTIGLTLAGLNTRNCRLYFYPGGEQRVANLTVLSACPHRSDKNGTATNSCVSGTVQWPTRGSQRWTDEEKAIAHNQIHLWSRTLDPSFEIALDIEAENSAASKRSRHTTESAVVAATKKGTKLKAQASCLYSDANQIGTIPALDELLKFAPVWAAITKANEGLVEVIRDIEI